MTTPHSPGDNPTTRRPRLLLADDDPKVSRAISRLLSPSHDIVGCVRDSPALFDAVRELAPEVVLLDFSLPGGLTGIDLCRRLKTMAPEVRVIALTASHDPELRQLALDAGASAFVWKLLAADTLLPTISEVMTAPGSK